MSAPITEAHIDLVRNMAAQGQYLSRSIQHYAQEIADSEAAAVQTAMLREYGNLCATNESLAKERDQLRAEVKLLSEWQAGVIENARAHHAQLKDAIARAERAEAELKSEQDNSVLAEAELAVERARLRDLWCEMALEFCDERISYVSVQITRSVWDELDAAMKEGAK